MWLFFQTPQTIQHQQSQSHFPRNRHHSSFHTRHHISVTRRPSTAATTTTTTTTNHLIQSLCTKGHIKQAIQILTQEPNPTQRTYELLILSCAVANSFSDAVTVNRHLMDDGFHEDTFLATKLIDMYSNLGKIEYARKVFDEMPKRTVYVYNAFFQALILANYGLDVFDIVLCMNTDGIKPDRFTYTYLLKACVASDTSVSLLPKGKEIHAHVLRHGFDVNVHIMTTLVDMYARFGFVLQAGHVFEKICLKNVVSWSAMIACYAKNGKAFDALQLFGEMMLEVNSSTLNSPNSVTMVSVLQACGALAALEQGRLLHGYVLRRGLDSVLPVLASLIAMYARCGELEVGKRVFDQMVKRDVVSWNAMISSYGMHGFGEKAIEVYNEMVSNKIVPSPITFVSVLGACSHSGLVDEGKSLFESITRDHNMRLTVEHYACMVDLLGRANRLNEAAKIIQDMRIEPGPKVWGSLLGSCRIHCNVELAERASKRLFELEPTNAGNYVLLAEIYAEARLWDEVLKVKKLLQTRGLQKKPGCSWIEVRKKIYSFESVDEFNPHVEQLHAFLLKLSMEMKEYGYQPKTKVVLYDVDEVEKERILLGHSEKLAVAFGLINSSKGETIRITKNLRLCEDCHSVTKFVSKFADREILVRDVNRIHRFRDGVCSCGDYW